MANQSLTQKTQTNTVAGTDLLYVVLDPSGAKLDRKITVDDFVASIGGTILGSGAVPQIAIWSGVNIISGNANFLYNVASGGRFQASEASGLGLGIVSDPAAGTYVIGDYGGSANGSKFLLDDANLRADLYAQDLYVRGYNNNISIFSEITSGYSDVGLGDVSAANTSTALRVLDSTAHVIMSGVFGNSFDADMSVNYVVSMGALGIGNGTKLVIDDVFGTTTVFGGTPGGSGLLVVDPALTSWFRVDVGNAIHTTFIGDIGAIHNGTMLSVDDINQAIKFTFGSTVNYTFPTTLPTSIGDVISVSNISGTDITLDWAAAGGGGNFLIGQTSGIVSAPAPGGTFEAWFGQLAGGGGASVVATTFLGYGAGNNATGADTATFVGEGAGSGATNASGGTFFGAVAGINAANAFNSTFIGLMAGESATNASESLFLGGNAGFQATDAFQSTFLGASAGAGAADAAHSIFIGFLAGNNDTVNNTVSGNSILIGDNSSTGGFQNSIGIGTGVINTAANQFLVDSPTSPFTGIGLNCPNGTFVAGDIGAAGNETAVEIDDAAQIARLGNPASFIETDGANESITNTTKIFWVGQNTAPGDLALRVDADVWVVQIGDIGGIGTGTKLTVADNNRTISQVALHFNYSGLQDFVNNAAALGGGLNVGDLYYTNTAGDGILKIVL